MYGYTDSTAIIGMNFKSNAPGLDLYLVVNLIPTLSIDLAKRGLITGDPISTIQNRQDFNQKLSVLTHKLFQCGTLPSILILINPLVKLIVNYIKTRLGYQWKLCATQLHIHLEASVSAILHSKLYSARSNLTRFLNLPEISGLPDHFSNDLRQVNHIGRHYR